MNDTDMSGAAPHPPGEPGVEPGSGRSHIQPGVFGVGAASLLSDTSHESVTALLPQFLASTMHTGPGVLGLIDGVADALTGISKLLGGRLAADPRRRGRLATSGYLSTALATALIGLTTAVWQVAALRGFAWVSRGLRTPARDMVLTDLARRGHYGKAFGIERAGDNAGAVLGPLCTSVLVVLVGVRTSMVLSIIPGVLACIAITYAARQAAAQLRQVRVDGDVSRRLGELRGTGLSRLLWPIGAFEMGNLASTLLILRATDLLGDGRSASAAAGLAIVLYAGHNVVASAASLLAGWLIDLWSPRLLLATGATCYAVAYLAFGAPSHGTGMVTLCFLLAGVGIGCGETAEGAMIANRLPKTIRAQGLGVLGVVQAAGDVGATVVGGALWSMFGAMAAFGYAAAWMGLSLVLGILMHRDQP